MCQRELSGGIYQVTSVKGDHPVACVNQRDLLCSTLHFKTQQEVGVGVAVRMLSKG